MFNPGPIQSLLLVVAGLVVVLVGIGVLSRSGKQSQNHAENARVGVSVFTGIAIVAAGLGVAALVSGPGQAFINWVASLFA